MPSAEYFRRQADICLPLSLAASDAEISSRLIMMAEEYKIRATAAEARASPPTEAMNPNVTPDSEAGHR